jgi:hypothetical protein
VADETVRKHHPYGLLDHVGHFFAEEFMVLISGLVWSPGNSGIILRCGPWGGREYDGGAMLGDMTEETFGRVVDFLHVGEMTTALTKFKQVMQTCML